MKRILRGLNKKLDFLNNSNWELINSEVNHDACNSDSKSSDDRQHRQSNYIKTDRNDQRSNSSSSSKGPDIMKYVSDETPDSQLYLKNWQ